MSGEARNSASGPAATEPVSGCLVRLGWMIAPTVLLLVLTISIAREERWSLGAKDVAFACVVLGAIILRYVDVARFGGRTLEGDAASLRDVRNYALGVVAASAACWALAHSIEIPR